MKNKQTLLSIFFLLFVIFYSDIIQAQIITTIAGNGTMGINTGDDGPATAAALNNASFVCTDRKGNIYTGINTDGVVRKIDNIGIITKFAGTYFSTVTFSGDGGPATAATIGWISGIAIDTPGNIYIVDEYNYRIRKVDTAGIITTIAGNGYNRDTGDGRQATAASIRPTAIAIDRMNTIYIASGYCVRRINSSGIIDRVAGVADTSGYRGDGGAATMALLGTCGGIAVDETGNVYYADNSNNRIRKFNPNTDGIITTIAGTGIAGHSGDGYLATLATMNGLRGLGMDKANNLYTAEPNYIRKIDTSGIISTIAGHGGIYNSGNGIPATDAMVSAAGIACDTTGSVFLAAYNYVRKITYKYRPLEYTDTQSQPIHVCENPVSHNLDTILSVATHDTGSMVTWLAISGPTNGVLSMAGNATSNGDTLQPSGLSYTPNTGYYGPDSFRIKVTNSFYSDTTTIHVIVDHTALATFGVSSVCQGATIAVTDPTPGGVWSSSNAAIATIDTAGNLTGIGGGVAIISYAINNICASGIITRTITVNPLPSPVAITGNTGICPGGTLHLADATSGGVWSSNNTGIATIGSTGILSGISAGTATISYSVTNSCGTTGATAVVTVNAIVSAGAITGTLSLCPGTTTALTATVPGGVWASSNTGIATVDGSGAVTGVSAGVAHITYSVSGACNAPYTTAAVTVNALPVAGSITGVDSFCALSVTAFVDGAAGGVWSSSNTGLAAVNSFGFATGIAAGLDTLAYNVANTCGSATAYKAVRVVPLAVAGNITGADSVCPAATIALSDAVTGGTWSSSFTSIATIGSTGIATGVAPGVDTLFYTTRNYCSVARAEKVVTVNPLPVAGTISGAGAICAGAEALLTDATSGGVWSSSNTGVATMGSAGTAFGVAAGGSTIAYTVTNSCGAAVAVYPITINPLPVAGTITGAATVCLDAHTTLSDIATGGVWSSSVTGIATVDGTGVITGVATGAATISYVITNGCGAATATIPVTVNPLPFAGAISGADAVCVGDSIVLADGVTGGVWASGASAIATVSGNGEVLGLSAGTTLLSYSVTNSCGTAVAAKPVVVNPLPDARSIAGAAVLCVDSSIALRDATTGGVWTSDGPDIAVVNAAGGVTGIGTGTAVISYTISNNCGTANATVTVTVAPCSLGVNTLSATNERLNIYPNPATQQLTISAAYNITTITISNPAGQKVFSAVADSTEVQMNIATLPAGMYFIQVNGGVVRKFVKE